MSRAVTRRRAWALGRWIVAAWIGLALAGACASERIQPADGGELQLVARYLGIAHPPGYPLYTLSAHTFGRVLTNPIVAALVGRPVPDLAIGDPGEDTWAWAINAFSAAMAWVTLGLVFATARQLTGRRAAGILAAAVLVTTPTFLAQTIVANIRMPTALFTALLFYLTVRWLDVQVERGSPAPHDAADAPRPGRGWQLLLLALVAGLAVGHHPSLAPVAVLAAGVVVARRPSVVRDPGALAAVAGGLTLAALPVLYLPWRDVPGVPLAPGTLTSVRGLLEHVSAYGFRGDALYFTGWQDLGDRLDVLWNVLTIQFGIPLLCAALVGAGWLCARRPAMGVLLVGTVAAVSFLAMTYRAPQTMEYLLPAYVAIAIAAGIGANIGASFVVQSVGRFAGNRVVHRQPPGAIGAREPVARPVSASIGVLIVIAIFVARPTWFWAAFDRGDTPGILRAAEIGCLPSGTVVLANWHSVTPLWYALTGRRRPHLTAKYVAPEGAEPYGETWRRRLAEEDGPAAVTNRTREMIDGNVALWPTAGGAVFASRPGLCESDAGAPPVDIAFGDRVGLRSAEVGQAAQGAASLEVAFEPVAPISETLTIVAQLVDPATGAVWGQIDHSHSAARWGDPRGLTDRLVIVPFAGAPTAPLDVLLGVYSSGPAGPARLVPTETPASLPSSSVAPTAPDGYPPPTAAEVAAAAPEVRSDSVRVGKTRSGLTGYLDALTGWDRLAAQPGAIPFGRAMVLTDAHLRRDGRDVVVDLTWRAGPGAADSDYTVSVQAHGTGWNAQHDGTPALGAIPTLKWLPGMKIRDRHRLRLPEDLAPDAPFTVTVGVYDAFTLEPLPVTDGTRVARGEGQAAVVAKMPTQASR